MKRIIVATVFCLTLLGCAQTGKPKEAEEPKEPDWVQRLPQNTESTVFFRGKSEPQSNYRNYQEARGSVIMDVLVQCMLYQGAQGDDTLTQKSYEYYYKEEEAISKIAFTDTSVVGLRRQGEWIAEDGTFYGLYAYNPSVLSQPADTATLFPYYPFQSNKVYFIGSAIAPNNNPAILSAQAGEDAKLQALLWLGGTATGNVSEYYKYYQVEGEEITSGACRAAVQFTSPINLQSLFFQEEAQYTKWEQDQQYHYYGLYSINVGTPETGAEQEYFSYQLEYAESTGKESFTKEIKINGNQFTQNQPYRATRQFNAGGDFPQGIRDALKYAPEDTVIGIGVERNVSTDIMNLRAATRAVMEICRQLNATVSYNGDETRSVSSATVRVTKRADVLADNGNWQVWETVKEATLHIPSDAEKSDAEKKRQEEEAADKRMKEALEKLK